MIATPIAPAVDDRWVVAIVDQIDALPATLADVADAYTVGWMSAEAGEPCEPLTHYIKLGEVENYIIGWKDATAALAETDDYANYVADKWAGHTLPNQPYRYDLATVCADDLPY